MNAVVARAACCVLLLLAACDQSEPPPQPVPPKKEEIQIDADRDNLLNLGRGASVVSRTAEMNLETSAAHAIDGDAFTYWKSPPGGATQTFVFTLPARSRIDKVGLIVNEQPTETPRQVRFEASEDGIAWSDVATIDVQLSSDPQRTNVSSFDAAYLRVHILEDVDYYSFVRSFLAYGREIAPPTPPKAAGCWMINGFDARFVQRGTSVAGIIASEPPLLLTGATNGRVLRLMWRRGAMWGHALFTTDPQHRTITGLRWHEEVRDQHTNDGWFGTPAECEELAVDETAIASAILERARKWRMYGDEALDTALTLIARMPSQRFLVVAHDQARLDATRKAFEAHRADLSRIEFEVIPTAAKTEAQRVIADGVELHLR